MSLYKQDSGGDWAREGNGFVRRSGVDETLQHATTRLRLMRGEVARDQRVGVDYDNIVWDPTVDESITANHLAQIIVETPGVVEAQTQFEETGEPGELLITFAGVFSDSNLQDERREHERVLVRLGEGNTNNP